ncbi:hypothetical protein [Candidatus Nitrospira bockiana]
MRSCRRRLLVLIASWAISVVPAFAEERLLAHGSEYLLTVDVREWVSQGRSAHNIGDLDGQPNVRSELTWRGVNSVVTQVSANLVYRRFVGEALIGYGGVGSGTLLDQDWDGANRTLKSSETISRVDDGHVFMLSLTPGARLVEWAFADNPVRGGVDLLIGYQLWQEKYVAFGGQDLLPGTRRFPGAVSLTQTNTWHSFRVGTRVIVPAWSWLTVKASAFYIPYSSYRNEDVHHLRSELKQDPSFLTTATGGNGVQLEGSIVLRVWRRLMLEAGYAYWDLRSGTGTVEQFFRDGSIAVGRHNEEHTRRHGVFFGVSWLFEGGRGGRS